MPSRGSVAGRARRVFRKFLLKFISICQDANYHKEPIVSKWLSDVCKSLSTTVRSAVTFPLSSSISMKQYLSGNEMKIAWDVVITAMLTTSGYCCVVGKQKDYVNNV